MLEPILALAQRNVYHALLLQLQSLLNDSNLDAGNLRPRTAEPSAFDDLIAAAAERYDVDASLLKAVVHAESNFSPSAVSTAGAKGLMQLMDATAEQLGVTDAFDPVQNVDGGARFLRSLLNRYGGNEVLALAAYNAGPGAVERWNGVPPYQETETYVSRVLDLRDQYREWVI